MTKEALSPAFELNKLVAKLGTDVSLSPPATHEEMVKQALSIAVQPEFVDQINDEVGDPREGESRDEYMDRAEKHIFDRLNHLIG